MLAGPIANAALLGIDKNNGDLYDISPITATPTLIGSTGIAEMGSLEFAPDGILYGFTTGTTLPSTATLYRIDPQTANATAIGLLNDGKIFEGALAFAPNGTAYGTNANSALSADLFTINLQTGKATTIGTISGGSHDINGLAWRSDGKLVGLDRVTNSLLAIDPTSAVSSVISPVTPLVGGVGGMAVLDGVGYFVTSGPGGSAPGSDELWAFDLFTGVQVRIGSLSPTITGTGIGGLAAIPEPTSGIAIVFSVAFVVRGRGKRGSDSNG